MSGHSKWSSIKHKKAATDAVKGKVFTKHAKLVALAARKGGDPITNPSLRSAIDNAKAENLPVDNIERAIKKGTGEGKDAAQFSEIIYEARGPAGVAILIEALTDNKNRTITNLKVVVSKNGGQMGTAGSVAYLFGRKGLITVPLKPAYDPLAKVQPGPPQTKSVDDIEMIAIDSGAEDVKTIAPDDSDTAGSSSGGPSGTSASPADIDLIEVYTDPQSLMQVRQKLVDGGVKVGKAILTYVPTQFVEVDDEATIQKIMDLSDAIEDDEDVNCVYTNLK
jgi:YebC/PmpR family DNA-binding regulatory protein